MASEKDVERGLDGETVANTESTSYQSDVEKAEPTTVEGATGYPDSDHEEVEQMDRGHLDDLARQHVSSPIIVRRWSILTSSDRCIY
jgi:hypothetical protein